MINSNIKNQKNSLIELMRFFFAMWVLYHHNYVPYRLNLWTAGSWAVEFFFVLSGFYLVRSIDKFSDLPLKNGLPKFLKARFMSIAVPFLINEIFVLYYTIVIGTDSNYLFGYMWYVRELFKMLVILFLLRKYIKNKRIFYVIIASIGIATIVFFLICPQKRDNGFLRAMSAMPIGMIAALIPKISVKNGKLLREKTSTAISIIGLASVSVLCLQITAVGVKESPIKFVLVALIYPLMIYFASCINCNSKFLNWLGSLSFPIYSFQCIIKVIKYYWVKDTTYLFIIIMTMVLLYSLIINLVKLKNTRIAK